MPKIPGMNGVPSAIVDYYLTHGIPGEVVSCRELVSPRDGVAYISLQFRNCSERHRWNDGNKAGPTAKWRADCWTLEVLPIK